MAIEPTDIFGKCPACGADWKGAEISPEAHEYYSEPYHWSRVIGIVENDRVIAWECPDCGVRQPRNMNNLKDFLGEIVP